MTGTLDSVILLRPASSGTRTRVLSLRICHTLYGFGNFKDDESVTYDVIGKALYAPFDENESRYIYDTFAKYALEEVANRFQDWWYNQDESDFED